MSVAAPATEATPVSPPAEKLSRLASLDRLRGLIMVLMALDHASGFVARHHASEFWAGELTVHASALSFVLRLVTHLCAPGFFFLTGCGIDLFARSRRAAGWSEWRIARTLVTRGLLLVLINQLVENPAWLIGILSAPPAAGAVVVPGGGGTPFLFTGVLTALGLSLVLGGLLVRFGSAVWLVLAAAGLWATSALVPPADQVAAEFPQLLRLLLVPGQTGALMVLYPVLPWFALSALGVVYARALTRAPARTLGLTPWIGLVLVAVALALRAAGGFGNIRAPRDGTWIEFLNFVKYPPALVFSLFTIGVDLMLLAALATAGRRLGAAGRWLERFGSVPLFFYLAHLYLYAVVGAAFFRSPASLEVMILVWLAGLVPLGWLCARYRAFKQRQPAGSVWRMF